MNVPDNYDKWVAHEAQRDKLLKSLPICVECDNPIQDEQAYYINGEWICENCMDTYKKFVGDFCE